jgi:hypothetical protein
MERIKNGFRRIWIPNEILFEVFWDAFVASNAVIVALRLVGYRGIAMTYFWVAIAFFGAFAILTFIRIKMEPKDKRLDDLIARIDKLIDTLDTANKKKETHNNEMDK